MSSTASEPVNEKVTTNQVDTAPAAPSEHGIHVVKRVHQDGTVDLIDAHAVGGEFTEMPAGYYITPNFIFTFIVSIYGTVESRLTLISAGGLSRKQLCLSRLGCSCKYSCPHQC
jgi:hypothetical protein